MIKIIITAAAAAYAVYAFVPRKLIDKLKRFDQRNFERQQENTYKEMCINFGVDPEDPNPDALRNAVLSAENKS